jgi:micrococcal nuclease
MHGTIVPLAIALVAIAVTVILLGIPRRSDRRRTLIPTRVLVTKVVDGDTIYVGPDPLRMKVRFKCVDTPETVDPRKPIQPYGPEASAFTKQALMGKWIDLEVDPEDMFDHFGRTLGYVFLEDGSFFNYQLVRLGYARSTTKRFPCRYEHDIEAAEAEAKAAHLGLWSLDEKHASCPIIGNSRSSIYHLPGQESYALSDQNSVCFETEQQAIDEGYRRSEK